VKILFICLLGMALVTIIAAASALFVMVGWNYGVRAAFPSASLGELNLFSAWCLSMLVASIGNAARTRLETNADRDN
jgi:hypothetical protein